MDYKLKRLIVEFYKDKYMENGLGVSAIMPPDDAFIKEAFYCMKPYVEKLEERDEYRKIKNLFRSVLEEYMSKDEDIDEYIY